MTRRCDAIGCQANTDTGRFMCPRHWRLVPVDLQRSINTRYRVGRKEFAFLSDPLYLQAAVDAVDAVAKKDGVQGPNSYTRLLAVAMNRATRTKA